VVAEFTRMKRKHGNRHLWTTQKMKGFQTSQKMERVEKWFWRREEVEFVGLRNGDRDRVKLRPNYSIK